MRDILTLDTFIAAIQLRLDTETGTVFMPVKVLPRARTTRLAGLLQGEEIVLKIRVQAAPEEGKANNAVEQMLLEVFSSCSISIVQGHTSPYKLVALKPV